MFIPYEIHPAQYNMDFDKKLLDLCEKEHINLALRFYGWQSPSLTLGRNQKNLGIDENFCKQNNIPIVRRITGGRALLHDKELTYTIICNKKILKNGTNIIADYKQISSMLIKALNLSGIQASYGEKTKSNIGAGYCMNLSTICDIIVDNKKFIGSAQYRTDTHILQHGSIPYLFDKNLINKIFQGQANFSQITCINEITTSFNSEKFMKQLKLIVEEELNAGKNL